jgi:subtilase family serine protease
MPLSRKLAPALAGLLAISTVAVAIPAAAAETSPTGSHASASDLLPTILPSVIPTWAKTATVLGATPADQTVFLSFALKGQDPDGEAAYGAAASTPGNPLYRHWLTKDEFEQTYGPAAGQADALVSVLKTLGITHVETDQLGLSVIAAVPASVVEAAFGVTFEQVMHGGLSTRVATSQPTLPAALLSLVAGVSGFTQERVHTDHTAKVAVSSPGGSAPTAYFNATPASTYYGSTLATDKPTSPILSGDSSTTKPYITSGYTPAQLRGAYGVDQVSQTGKGVKVGIALFYDGPDVASDLATFSAHFGLAAPSYTDLSPENEGTDLAVGNIPVLDPLDAEGEQTLDAEAIHQMAPDASIYYSGAVAPEDPTIYAALDTAIAAGVNVINNSYGGTGDTDAADAAVFEEDVTGPAETMGVGLDFSSGDSGDHVASDSDREADFPATSDEVTAVGGTGLEVGPNNNYEGEFYWGTYSATLSSDGKSWGTFYSQAGGAGGGGGVSTNYAEPAWQQGVVPAEETENADTGAGAGETTGVGVSTPGRVLPDVAMLADSTTGILVGETQMPDVGADGTTASATPTYSYYRIGGTSVSSPLFTGMMALVDQAIGTSAGFVNPTIYPFEAKKDGSFRDPQIGRSPTGSRLGSTAAQIEANCSSAGVCAGAGPGVVPVVAEVRSDYTDTANDGIATVTTSDPTGLGVGVTSTVTPGNPVIYHLRAQGVLGTLEDLPGYDDSTGLGSPDAPQFIADFEAATGTTPPASVPEVPTPVLILGVGLVIVGVDATRRRRRRGASRG